MSTFIPVTGTVISIETFQNFTNDNSACTLLIGVRGRGQELTYFTVDLDTYFINNVTIRRGDSITAFYDSSLPVVLIFPPRYRAVVIAKNSRNQFVKVDYFDNDLVSSDNELKLNISPQTRILLTNNQTYLGSIENRNLVVVYSFTTRSIPAITTPSQVIVLCP